MGHRGRGARDRQALHGAAATDVPRRRHRPAAGQARARRRHRRRPRPRGAGGRAGGLHPVRLDLDAAAQAACGLRQGRAADGHPREPRRGRTQRGLEGTRRTDQARRPRRRGRYLAGGAVSSLEPRIVPDDQHHDKHHDPGDPGPEPVPPLEVEVRRNAAVSALVGAASSAMAIAYITRAVSTGGVFDWVFGLVLGAVGVSQLVSLVDSRTPLLVADGLGVRLRLGREWRGLPWDSLEQVVVEPRTSLLHDGRLVVAPRHLNRALEGLDRKARRQVALSQKLYNAPLVVPLGMTTRVSTDDLVAELTRLSHDRAAVVEIAGYVAQPVEPVEPVEPDGPDTVSRREEVLDSPPQPEEPAARGGTPVEGHEPRTPRLRGGLGTIVSRIGHGRAHDIDAGEPGELPATTTATATATATPPATPTPTPTTTAAASSTAPVRTPDPTPAPATSTAPASTPVT